MLERDTSRQIQKEGQIHKTASQAGTDSDSYSRETGGGEGTQGELVFTSGLSLRQMSLKVSALIYLLNAAATH